MILQRIHQQRPILALLLGLAVRDSETGAAEAPRDKSKGRLSRRRLLRQAARLAGAAAVAATLGKLPSTTAAQAVSPEASGATRRHQFGAARGATVSTGGAYRYAPSMAPDQAAADQELQNSYTTWKSRYVTGAGAGGHLRVQRGPENGYDTVSEGIAYGMLLAAYLGERPILDGLWAYARSHLDANGLMHWKIDANNSVTGHNAATDADEDMALALIVADKKWGGYAAAAKDLIGKILRHEVEGGSLVLKPGDAWGGSEVTNPSYFTPAYYKVFRDYTGDTTWNGVVDRAYQIIANVNAKTGAGVTGLQPDWTTAAGDRAPHYMDRPDYDSYTYHYDAARVPWRLAMDAAWYDDPRARGQLDRLNRFFQGLGAGNIGDWYRLDGTVIRHNPNATFTATAASGAIVATDAAYKTALWNQTVALTNGGYYNDSLRVLGLLFMSGNMPNPLDIGAPPTPPTTPTTVVLDDFESGTTGKWTSFGSPNSTIARGVVSPGAVGSYAMAVDYAIGAGGWGGVAQDFAAPQDWRGHQGLTFRFQGTGSGNTIRLELSDNRAPGSTGDTSERYVYTFVDNFTGWKPFSLPWGDFVRRADWQPTGAPNDGLTLAQVYGFNFAPTGGSGRFQLDQVELMPQAALILDDFESGTTGKWTSFSNAGSTIARGVVSPGATGNYAMKVDYTIGAGGWGGVSQDFATPQDWRDYRAFEFRFQGTGSGNTIRLELSDNRAPGSTGDTSERYVYTFVDNFTGWKPFSLPWGDFVRRADWQPTGAPNDGLTLAQVYGFNFAPTGGSGRFQLDQVQLVK